MQPHEYSVIGHSRSAIGNLLGTTAALAASFSATSAIAALDLAKKLGWFHGKPEIILFPLTASVFYGAAHFVFNKWVWKQRPVSRALSIPDLNGEWECDGISAAKDDQPERAWSGIVRITQTWERIRVYLNTGTSSSKSISAALVPEPGRGFVLMYTYDNRPGIAERELSPHRGYCELQIRDDATSAVGEYFNNFGRDSCGTMTLKRKVG